MEKTQAMEYLLKGQRQEAVAGWEQFQHANPSDASTAHALLIASFWEAMHHEASERQAEASQAWQRVIRNAVLLLHNRVFWEEWQQQCAERYETAIDNRALSEVQHRLEQHLLNRLPSHRHWELPYVSSWLLAVPWHRWVVSLVLIRTGRH